MDPLVTVILAIVALVVGALLGWFAAGRTTAPLREDNARLREEVRIAEEQGRQTVADLRTMLDGVRDERDTAQRELSGLKAAAEERDRAFEARLAELREAKDLLAGQFREVGEKMLGEARKKFIEDADSRFNQAGERNEAKLKALLLPVGERLKAYEEQVGKVERERTEAYGDIKSTIEQMRAGQERVQAEAARLVNSLRNAPKARGRWGEQQLRNVLETCGLSEHTDFHTEVSIETEDGRMRPDATVRVPGGSSLIIDAKVSLNDYQDAFNADDNDAREAALTRHCVSMKAHIDGLSKKAYWDSFKEAPDYVIMFVPGEHFLTAALEHDSGLWDYAFEKKVLLATPTNLIAIARTVAAVWRQEVLAAEAQEIGELGKEMYDRLAIVAEKLGKTGGHLDRAVKSYNDSVSSFNSRLVVTGRKFAEKSVNTGKRELEDVALVESLAHTPETDALPTLGKKAQDKDTDEAAG